MMLSTREFLKKYGFYCFLVPAFFILHSYIQYYGLVSGKLSWRLFLEIEIIFLFGFIIVYILTREINKSLAITATIGAAYLFYGVIKDFISLDMGLVFLAKYKVLLPLVFICVVYVVVKLFRKKQFGNLNLYLNSLLVIFILIDALLLQIQSRESLFKKNLLAGKNKIQNNTLPQPGTRPDIYYLVFDCYPGTQFLKEYMQFDNAAFNEDLSIRGFQIIPDSRSNYNRTAFSIASTLNFEYLEGIKSNVPISPEKYTRAISTIKYASVPTILNSYGYDIYNLSVFELRDEEPIHKETFLTLPETQVLLYNTLGVRFTRDVLWNFLSGKHSISFLKSWYSIPKLEEMESQVQKKIFNNEIIDSTQAIAKLQTGKPKFVYSHFYLPHPPFFYTADGKENNIDSVITEESLKNKDLFLSYLQYTNKIVLQEVDAIQKNSKSPPIIIVQSDHGFRDFDSGPTAQPLYFMNYSAFYFPDKNYATLRAGLSNINTFPIILNKYFGFSIPLQKDSTVFLPY